LAKPNKSDFGLKKIDAMRQPFSSTCKADSAKNQITAADEPYTQPVTFFDFSIG
jgi:hypothetical protein